jgi:tetratricopeptide (TPR) repeat protein
VKLRHRKLSSKIENNPYGAVFIVPMQTPVTPFRIKQFIQRCAVLPLAVVLCAHSALAVDPFRVGIKARPMGLSLESAFKDFFLYGKYQSSIPKLAKAQVENPNEPLVYTLQAATAYQNQQNDKFLASLSKIRDASKAIAAKDSARSHLYQGVAQGLEGYFLKDSVTDLPKTLTYASSMLLEIDKAHQLSPNDPEINLFVGFINMVLGKNDEALQNFQKAGPPYLALRGQALVYRDTRDYGKAQIAVDKAISVAPQNPELLYLKAQILVLQKNPTEAMKYFDQALKLGKELPADTLKQINKERSSIVSLVPSAK